MLKYAAAFCFLLVTPVLADSIDGTWCQADGRQLSIQGPQIVLPSGKSIAGQYGRHEFAYQTPAGETGAGQVTYMQLFSEDDMASFPVNGDKLGEPTPWHRCAGPPPKTS
jgi:hypothetical protein